MWLRTGSLTISISFDATAWDITLAEFFRTVLTHSSEAEYTIF